MRTVCLRLRRGDDLLLSLQELARRESLRAAVVLSGVGCVTEAQVRDASGVTVRHIDRPCEIVALQGTVSAARCHVHIALADEDMHTLGGHLMAGTRINTTCELVLLEQDGWRYGVEQDRETGYDEIVFQEDV
jgi:predicted DNA-binding protein with PD1-like motif